MFLQFYYRCHAAGFSCACHSAIQSNCHRYSDSTGSAVNGCHRCSPPFFLEIIMQYFLNIIRSNSLCGMKSVSLDYRIYIGSSTKNIYLFFTLSLGKWKKARKNKKNLVDDKYSVCYISLAMEVGLFFMPFFRSDLFSTKRCRKTQRI
mgnify:CR=1 FL=1